MIVLKALWQGGAWYLWHCDDSSQTVLEHHRYHLYTISICVDSSRTVLQHHRYHLPIYFLISFFLYAYCGINGFHLFCLYTLNLTPFARFLLPLREEQPFVSKGQDNRARLEGLEPVHSNIGSCDVWNWNTSQNFCLNDKEINLIRNSEFWVKRLLHNMAHYSGYG